MDAIRPAKATTGEGERFLSRQAISVEKPVSPDEKLQPADTIIRRQVSEVARIQLHLGRTYRLFGHSGVRLTAFDGLQAD